MLTPAVFSVELKKMFDVFPTQRPRTTVADEVVDRNAEMKLLDSRSERRRALERPAATASGSIGSDRLPKTRPTQISELLASGPSEDAARDQLADPSRATRTTRGKTIP